MFLCYDSSGTCIKIHHGMPKKCSCARCGHSCFIYDNSFVFLCYDSSGTCIKIHHGMPKKCSCARCGHSCFDAQNSPRFWECNDVMASYIPSANVRKYFENF